MTNEEHDAVQILASDLWAAADPFEQNRPPQPVPHVYVSIAMALARSGWRKV